MALIFDIETNGLLHEVTTIHCLCIKDTETGLKTIYRGHATEAGSTIQAGLDCLMKADMISGHNVISYDIPVITKLYPAFTVDKTKVLDTIVGSRLVWSDIKLRDVSLVARRILPGKLMGSQSLKAWGIRLGLLKGDYVDNFKEAAGEEYVEGSEWLHWSQDMEDYCLQDVEVTESLFNRIVGKKYPEMAMTLEHEAAWLMAKQTRNGFCFDEAKAKDLYVLLASKRYAVEQEMKTLFDPWEVRMPDFIPKRDNKAKGFTKGVPVKKYKTVEFNPSSRIHIADRLMVLRGWVPTEFTPAGGVKVDDEVIEALDYPECKVIAEYLLLDKRIGQLAEGKQGWLKQARDGFIYGSVNPNGTITGRGSHSYPNVAQVPASRTPYGHECRELFTVPAGWVLCGSDVSGLELRCLSHYMAIYDDGAYAEILLNGDIHTVNMEAAGLPTRDNSKTFIYAFLYGGGDAKIGKIVGGTPARGKALKKSFLEKTPAIALLKQAVEFKAKTKGQLVGIDGRQLFSKSPHSSLNLLLQSAGALICKKWIVLIDQVLTDRGLKHGWDGDYAFCAWVHDEVQIAARTPEIAAVIEEVCKSSAVAAGEFFKFRIAIASDTKVGPNWAATH